MGLFVSKLNQIYQNWGSQIARILILGLDGAGKTSILYKLKRGQEIITKLRPIGFNVESIEVGHGFTLNVWDIGGNVFFRHGLYQHYFQNADGIIYVVDSNDKQRLNESYDELYNLITNATLRKVPVLFFVNKQDLPNSLSVSEVTEKMRMHSLRDRAWHVKGCSAATGEGLMEGMNKLCMMAKTYKRSKSKYKL